MIGIFDSGLGGLTALKEIKALTGEDLVYFGDTGRVPYGGRSFETIRSYAKQDAAFLMSMNVDAIVVACGTVSTTAISYLKEMLDVPVIDVVEPSSLAAVKATKNKRIAVIGTAATIKSGAFEKCITGIDPEISVLSVACPLFVPLVENGFADENCEITRLTAEHYLKKIKESGADTLILGCTHYPIISKIIAKVLPGVTLISSGEEAAKRVVNTLGSKQGSSKTRYYVSDDPEMFIKNASIFLGEELTDKVEKIDINEY